MKKSAILLYDVSPTQFCLWRVKHLAFGAAIYTLSISVLVALLYTWRIYTNLIKQEELQEVYYGVQIAYSAIVATHIFTIFLSVLLICGIVKEQISLVTPWLIGLITLMALEAVATVYSNVLREHVYKEFDVFCKAEMTFFLSRTVLNVISIWIVLRFSSFIQKGFVWVHPDSIEL